LLCVLFAFTKKNKNKNKNQNHIIVMSNHKLVYHKTRKHCYCYSIHIDRCTPPPGCHERTGTAALHALSLAFTIAGFQGSEGAARLRPPPLPVLPSQLQSHVRGQQPPPVGGQQEHWRSSYYYIFQGAKRASPEDSEDPQMAYFSLPGPFFVDIQAKVVQKEKY
jgi:hypothetical protein